MTSSFVVSLPARTPLKTNLPSQPNARRSRCEYPHSTHTLHACESNTSDFSLSEDQKAIADAAVRVTHQISHHRSSLTTLDLLAFCNVKSIPLPHNIWDRNYLESAVKEYQKNELLARTKAGSEWEALTEKAKIKLLHDVCNGEGDVTYIDPATGYTVFSYFAHLKRGHCCGIQEKDGVQERTHRCRHCPYKDDGTLTTRMLAAKERIRLVEYVRKHVTESWESFDGLSLKSDASSPGPTQTVSTLSECGLRAKYARVVKIDKKPGDWNCDACADEKIVTCTRCSGWTFLISPEFMSCPQCGGKGYHPCMNCTSFRPPQRTSFYS